MNTKYARRTNFNRFTRALAVLGLLLGSILGACGDGDGETAATGGEDAPLPLNSCRVEADCTGSGCMLPDPYNVIFPCNYCEGMATECSQDQDCKSLGEHFICQKEMCSCNALAECMAGCTSDGECASGEACSADHRCVLKACGTDADCGQNHVCGSDKVCIRKPCSHDADCQGTCVLGACHEKPGFCYLG